ncbi:hypothetical protein BJ912DRAFT_1065164 [Pholiota molesta]|nr:hypothetical protein BJ912DRAFT_1065164 [Pholiota molesta]
MSYVGMAASIGIAVDIPIILRSLADSFGMHTGPEQPVKFDIAFISVLATETGSNQFGRTATSYKFEWWKQTKSSNAEHLSASTLEQCLQHHREVLQTGFPVAEIPVTPIPAMQCMTGAAPVDMHCPCCDAYQSVANDLLDTLAAHKNLSSAMESAVGTANRVNARTTAGSFLLHAKAIMKETDVLVEIQQTGRPGSQADSADGFQSHNDTPSLTVQDIAGLQHVYGNQTHTKIDISIPRATPIGSGTAAEAPAISPTVSIAGRHEAVLGAAREPPTAEDLPDDLGAAAEAAALWLQDTDHLAAHFDADGEIGPTGSGTAAEAADLWLQDAHDLAAHFHGDGEIAPIFTAGRHEAVLGAAREPPTAEDLPDDLGAAAEAAALWLQDTDHLAAHFDADGEIGPIGSGTAAEAADLWLQDAHDLAAHFHGDGEIAPIFTAGRHEAVLGAAKELPTAEDLPDDSAAAEAAALWLLTDIDGMNLSALADLAHDSDGDETGTQYEDDENEDEEDDENEDEEDDGTDSDESEYMDETEDGPGDTGEDDDEGEHTEEPGDDRIAGTGAQSPSVSTSSLKSYGPEDFEFLDAELFVRPGEGSDYGDDDVL